MLQQVGIAVDEVLGGGITETVSILAITLSLPAGPGTLRQSKSGGHESAEDGEDC